MKKVLILGGAGFIGFNIAEKLSEDINCQLTIADNLSRGKKDDYMNKLLLKSNVNLVEGDFTKEEIDLAESQDFQMISIGNSRLRTETACITAVSLLKLG